MSWLSDTSELVSGGWLSSVYEGHGIRGDQVPSTGTHGPSPLYNDLSLPADAAKEYRWVIVSPPSVGTIAIYEDGSYVYTAPGGTVNLSVTYQYRIYQDGVDLGIATETITIGSVGITLVADSFTFTLTPSPASLLLDRLLIADPSSVVLTPQDLTFLLVSEKLISADPASFVITPLDALITVGSVSYVYPLAQYVRANLSYGPTGSEFVGTYKFDVLVDIVTGQVVSNTDKTIAIPAGSTITLNASDVKRGISFGVSQTGTSDGFLCFDTKTARLIKPVADKLCIII